MTALALVAIALVLVVAWYVGPHVRMRWRWRGIPIRDEIAHDAKRRLCDPRRITR
jgi:hypothetical protein